MLLYPTETIYALGVNAVNVSEIEKLYQVKGREAGKSVSWLVRDLQDIAHYGELSPAARRIAEAFLPGSLTLVLPAQDEVPRRLRGPDDTVSFRISPDPVAQAVIERFMSEHKAPLSCTSANVSGQPTLPTPREILEQLGKRASQIEEVVDDDPREGTPSTVVRVFGDGSVKIVRKGAVSEAEIRSVVEAGEEVAVFGHQSVDELR